MDDFTKKLGEQVNTFTKQAVKVDQWDRQTIEQRDRALQLHQASTSLKQGAAAINAELEGILQRQEEMHNALSELEKKVEAETHHLSERPSERQQAYDLAESLDKEIGEMRETLEATVEKVNDRRQADAQGQTEKQLEQMVRVLDVHLNAFKWLETQSGALDENLRMVDSILGHGHGQRLHLGPPGSEMRD